MGTAYILCGLRLKRAHLAGEIEAEEKRQAERREALAQMDAVIRLFEPTSKPELIASIRPRSRRNLSFKRGEQSRLCIAALREAGKPISCRAVTEYALAAKGLSGIEAKVRLQLTNQFRTSLVRPGAKGVARKIVTGPDAWWELVVRV